MENNRNNFIVWGFFCLVFVGSYTLLLQRYPNPSLPSALIALALTFILDKIMQKRKIKDKSKIIKDDPKFLRKKAKNSKKSI